VVTQGRTFAPVLIALVEVLHVYPLGHSLSNRVPQGRSLIVESGYAGSERVPVDSGLGQLVQRDTESKDKIKVNEGITALGEEMKLLTFIG
jgi:hypothetical protein